MTLATVTMSSLTYWITVAWYWVLGFTVGLSIGVNWGMRIYKRNNVRYHIDQESVNQLWLMLVAAGAHSRWQK